MSQKTLLFVDDEQDIVDALSRTVRDGGYRILGASSAERALQLLEEHPIDLIVCDVDMPGKSGLELAADVRRSHPKVVRFILTGVASLESAMTAINDAEVHRYLTKPWDKNELRSAIREGLERADAQATSSVAAGAVDPDVPLSPRLRQTLDQLMTGACSKEVATNMGITVNTARQYVKMIYRRFKVTSRAELMAAMHGHR